MTLQPFARPTWALPSPRRTPFERPRGSSIRTSRPKSSSKPRRPYLRYPRSTSMRPRLALSRSSARSIVRRLLPKSEPPRVACLTVRCLGRPKGLTPASPEPRRAHSTSKVILTPPCRSTVGFLGYRSHLNRPRDDLVPALSSPSSRTQAARGLIPSQPLQEQLRRGSGTGKCCNHGCTRIASTAGASLTHNPHPCP